MATKLFSVAPGGTLEGIVEATGSATVTTAIELTVDLATTIMTEGASTRAVKRGEVLLALELLYQYIAKSTDFIE